MSAPAPPAPALALENVTSGYRGATVLRDVTLHVPAGRAVALLGPNGAGKTTLLRTVSGLLRPTAGQVYFDGAKVTALSAHRRARLGLCDIPEGRGIFPSLTVKENLVLQSRRRQERRTVEVAVEIFPRLGDLLRRTAGTLSGGEQQMLALVRAYATEPRLVLVDELSLGLAPLVIDRLFEILTAMVERGTALLLVEQYVTRALELASEAYVLTRGAVVFSGPAAELSDAQVFEHYLSIDVGRNSARPAEDSGALRRATDE